MRGYLSLEPAPASVRLLVGVQNQLRDGLHRQGVHFQEPDRFGPTLIQWPFGTDEEIETAVELCRSQALFARANTGNLAAKPGIDRPAEIGYPVECVLPDASSLVRLLQTALDPDPPRSPWIRLARISPASRKVGIALKASGLYDLACPEIAWIGLGFWQQSPDGFRRRAVVEF